MNCNLAEIILQNIEFFRFSDESDMHPDAAVRQLEIISRLLKEIPEGERNCFFETAKRRLEQLRRDGAPQEQIALLENLRENLGL